MTIDARATRRERFVIYGVVIALGVILVIIGLAAWRANRADRLAYEKAGQLIAAFSAAGAQTPPAEQVVRLLGDDGGAVCATPGEALTKAALLGGLANGAGGPGSRPVIAGSTLVRGEAVVISVYCPEKLPEFQQFVDGLRTRDAAGE